MDKTLFICGGYVREYDPKRNKKNKSIDVLKLIKCEYLGQ